MGLTETRKPAACFVYGLVDPRTDRVHYVGQSTNPEKRLVAHVRPAGPGADETPKERWISELRAEGLEPKLETLEEVRDGEEAPSVERWWIDSLSRAGRDLTNAEVRGKRGGLAYDVFGEVLNALARKRGLRGASAISRRVKERTDKYVAPQTVNNAMHGRCQLNHRTLWAVRLALDLTKPEADELSYAYAWNKPLPKTQVPA